MFDRDELVGKIDEWITSIWENEICEDYKESLIQNESTLQAAFYYHLRPMIRTFNLSQRYQEFICAYCAMEFRTKGRRSRSVDLAVVAWDKKEDMPLELFSVLEFKYYEKESEYQEACRNKAGGVRQDIEKCADFGEYEMSYRYDPLSQVWKPGKAYLLYLVDKGRIELDTYFDSGMQEMVTILEQGGYLNLMLGSGRERPGDEARFVSHYQ